MFFPLRNHLLLLAVSDFCPFNLPAGASECDGGVLVPAGQTRVCPEACVAPGGEWGGHHMQEGTGGG